MNMQKDQIINCRYKILSELGKGGYGMVYKVQDLSKYQDFAMKIDLTHRGSVIQEAKILQDLQGGEGIAKLYETGKTSSFTYMVMELLGSNLSSMRKSLNGFSLNTVILLMIETLSRIEYVHTKGFIHRDVKPQQFLVGPKDTIYITDFGISKKYIIDGHHMAFQSHCERAGSSSYASVNSHIGVRLSRRDDLESWVYMAIYLVQGFLPWQQGKTINDHRKWQTVFTLKREIKDEVLFVRCPKQFISILNYIRSVKFEEKPNYSYIKDQLLGIKSAFCLKNKFFDWVLVEKNKNKKEEDEKKKGDVTKRRSDKKKTRLNRRNKTMNSVCLNQLMANDTKSFLQIPIVYSRTASRNSQDLDSSDCETNKCPFPEFANRAKIFETLQMFRQSLK